MKVQQQHSWVWFVKGPLWWSRRPWRALGGRRVGGLAVLRRGDQRQPGALEKGPLLLGGRSSRCPGEGVKANWDTPPQGLLGCGMPKGQGAGLGPRAWGPTELGM